MQIAERKGAKDLNKVLNTNTLGRRLWFERRKLTFLPGQCSVGGHSIQKRFPFMLVYL